jgi:protein SCO1
MTRRPSLPVATAMLAALVAALVFALAEALGGSQGGSHPSSAGVAGSEEGTGGFDGAALPAPPLAPDFTLTDQAGRRVSLRSYRGRAVVVTFLDSRCGACTLIAQQIRGALDELARPVPVLIVSVDPSADDAASVRGFLGAVSLLGRARYLTGPPAALPRVWHAYRITTPASGSGAFERAASVFLIDGHGRERVVYQQEQLTPEALAHDIGRLQEG